ncbi:hypothetical protein ASA1KI_24750 [Opitutales bacterium ASA1]|uniref:polysaccharide pyruvyl transferase family protein n=1 Tax=Congregicoccus parvus TaxID=3081749 RepID=UPI002B2DE007|nr:hypothetical protein ASA1KI_24750 [Opitutales bacterium ASA1]
MIHHVFANRSNAGDWLSALGIQALLSPLPVREHLCDGPFVEKTLDALADVRADDLVVVGGGGLFLDYFEPLWRGLLPIARRVPLVIWGVGVCDSVHRASTPSRALVQDVVGAARLCAVRDGLTRAFIDLPQVREPIACTTLNALEGRTSAPDGLVLHADHYDNVGADNFEKMERFAAAHAAATQRRHRKTNNILEPGRRDALDRIVGLYTSADVLLTSRLHGCIIAAAVGCPFLAVTGDRKVDSFMQATGLQRWLCSLDEVDSVPARLEALDRERPTANAFVAAARRDNRAFAEEVCHLAHEASAS